MEVLTDQLLNKSSERLLSSVCSELISNHNQLYIDLTVTPLGQLQNTSHVISSHHHASQVSLLFSIFKQLLSLQSSPSLSPQWLQSRYVVIAEIVYIVEQIR